MTDQTNFIIHWGAPMTCSGSEFEYDMCSPLARNKRLKFGRKPSYDELLARISRGIGLENNETIARILYKYPIVGASSLSYSYLFINNDDGIDFVYDNLSYISGYRNVELFVLLERVYDHVTPLNIGHVNYEVPNSGYNYGNTLNYGEQTSNFLSLACGQSDLVQSHQPESNQGPSYDMPINDFQRGGINQHEASSSQYVTRIMTQNEDDITFLHGGEVNIDSDYEAGGEEDFDHNEFDVDVDDENVDHIDGREEIRENIDMNMIPTMAAVTTGMTDLNFAPLDYSGQYNVPEVIPEIAPLSSFIFSAPAYSMIEEDRSYGPSNENEEIDVWDGVSEFRKGLVFSGKDDVQAAVNKYSMKHNVMYKTVESTKVKLVLQCVCVSQEQQQGQEQNCRWWFRAYHKKNEGYWIITSYKGPHTCIGSILTQDHGKLSSKMISRCIIDMVAKEPRLSCAVIQANIRTQFSFSVSYKKAWFGKKKALEMVFGNWEGSYNRLPRYLNALRAYNPGTVTYVMTDETQVPNCEIFKRVFWSFKPCIEGFKYCRPVIFIDGTFLYGKYKHTLLVATAFDGNNHILPIAFAIVECENNSSWAWFMESIRRYVTQRTGLCVISDRHAGILNAMSNPSLGWAEPMAFHRWCLRHFVSNYNHSFHRTMIKKLLYKAGSQSQPRKFTKMMEAIRGMDQNSYNWAMERPMDRWSLAHDNGGRYGNMTTNIAECVNNILKGIRQMPIQSIVEHTFAKMVNYFDSRRKVFSSLIEQGDVHTPACKDLITRYSLKANGHKVTHYDSRTGLCHVETCYDPIKRKGGNTQIVNLYDKKCSCNKFQNFGIPCSHAIAVCMQKHISFYSLIDKEHTLEETLKVYNYPFQPLAHEDYWPQFTSPNIIVNPTCKRKKGRPKSTRIRNEMDLVETGTTTYACSICGRTGHNKKSCRDRPTDMGGQTGDGSSRGRNTGGASRASTRN